MTDFHRTSISEAANILSPSCDKLLVTAPPHSCENLKPRTGLIRPSDDVEMSDLATWPKVLCSISTA